ncbi:MAG: SpoIID/LytB domain-containing protein [Solirubrobacteraceae bacterium]
MGPPILDRVGVPAAVFTREQMSRIDATYHRPAAAPVGRRDTPWGAALMRLCLLLAGLAAALAGPSAASAAAASSPQTLLIEGAGEGHGVGMSQLGALGYARHGLTYQAILAHYYTGTTIGQVPAGTIVKVLVGSKVKRVPLERYVSGVISGEMPSSWPAAALEAQAVASRTYALTAHAGGSRFDVYSDTRSQVYRGVAAETSATNAAVAATAGQVVMYAGKPAITYFFASSGGMTEDVENGFPGAEPEPWLRAVADSYEGSSSRWKVEVPFADAAHRLAGLFKGSFRGIEVLKRGISPRILTARVLGTKAASTVSGPELAGRLGLASTWEYFSVRVGSSLKAEPDHSGQQRTWTPSVPSVPAGPGASGGVAPAPASGSAVSAGASGGTVSAG